MVARDENADTSRDGSGVKSRAEAMSDIPRLLTGASSLMDEARLPGPSATRGAADIGPAEARS